MKFSLWLESNDIKVSRKSNDGTSVTIVFPCGIYEYESPHYGEYVNRIYRKFVYKPGAFANELKNMVNRGLATVTKVS